MKPQRVIEHRQASSPVRCGCGGAVKLVILPSPVPLYNLHVILRCEFYNPPEEGQPRMHFLESHGVLPDEELRYWIDERGDYHVW